MASLRLTDGGNDAPVIAQYLVNKITLWGAYRRILTVSATHVSLYNPEDFSCTNQWFLSFISDIEIAPDPDHFILVFEKVRFHSSKLRFHCHARSHLLALLHKLRRQYSFLPLRINNYDPDTRRQHYQCSEHFADDSYDYFLLQVGLSGVTLLDEHGHRVSRFSFISIQRIATSSAHPGAIVISTVFQERLFLCRPRNDCIDHMCAAAQALGITIPVEDSPLNMQLLRLRNSMALDNPAVVCFEVIKSVDDGKIEQHIQLIFQGVAMIEVHRKMRTIITRPYSTLLAVVLSDWDADTVVLQFVQDENLVVRVESRNQFIAILLLVCREAGNHKVELSPTIMKKNRLYHPHITEKVRETAGISMETFFLRRVLRVLSQDAAEVRSMSPLKNLGFSKNDTKKANGRRRETRKQRRRGAQPNAVLMEARLSVETGITLNDHISLGIALEELNANVSLGGISDSCNRHLLNKTIDVLIDHLASQVASLRAYTDAPMQDIVITLQSLTRLAESRHAYFAQDQVPVLFDVLHEVIIRRHFLSTYWVLMLLQRYFEPRKGPEARLQRSRALQAFVDNRELLYAILDVIPSMSSLSRNSSGRWMKAGSETMRGSRDDDSDAHLLQDLSQTLLFTKEERLEKDMNILTYEALFTLHHVLVFLQAKEKHEVESVAAALAKSKVIEEQRAAKAKDWAATIEFAESEYDQANFKMTTAAKRAIGERLLSKHKFLMDSVVDVRLARSCQTIVALINFLVFYFTQQNPVKSNDKSSGLTRVPPGGFVLYEDERADLAGTVLYQIGAEDQYRRKRETMPMRRSVLDNPADEFSPEETETRAQERKLDELFAFLECYQADVVALDDRSRLFPEQNTILLPLSNFSLQVSSVSSSNSVFNVSGSAFFRVQPHDEDFLTLDQLFDEEEEGAEATKTMTTQSPAEASYDMRYASMNRPLQPKKPDMKRSGVWPETSTISDELSIVITQPESGGSLVPHFMKESNFRRLDSARNSEAAIKSAPHKRQPSNQYAEKQTVRGVILTERVIDIAKKRETPISKPRRPASMAVDQRISAHICDACIACNDVCENDNCFFCAEKEYQLKMAFDTSSSLPPLQTSSTLSSSSSATRKYSSCELRRHQTARSCWIVIFGMVYDVTDLLSSHPGGMDMLLKAATIGKDMGELFIRKHPPRARQVLDNYYLGEYYHCENRTVLV